MKNSTLVVLFLSALFFDTSGDQLTGYLSDGSSILNRGDTITLVAPDGYLILFSGVKNAYGNLYYFFESRWQVTGTLHKPTQNTVGNRFFYDTQSCITDEEGYVIITPLDILYRMAPDSVYVKITVNPTSVKVGPRMNQISRRISSQEINIQGRRLLRKPATFTIAHKKRD